MPTRVAIRWTVEPSHYLSADGLRIPDPDADVTIDKGSVEARLPADVYWKKLGIKERIQQIVLDVVGGIEFLTGQKGLLSEASVVEIEPDGTETPVTELVVRINAAPKVSMQIIATRGAGGPQVHNSDVQRDVDLSHLSSLVLSGISQSASGTILGLLRSISASRADPANELVHLYEVRDALSKEFGSEAEARKALGTTKADWSRLGQLCNDAPVRQGRHRGKVDVAGLRDATEQELTEARRIVRRMLDAYVASL